MKLKKLSLKELLEINYNTFIPNNKKLYLKKLLFIIRFKLKH